MWVFPSRDNRKKEMLQGGKHENKEDTVRSSRRKGLGRSAFRRVFFTHFYF